VVDEICKKAQIWAIGKSNAFVHCIYAVWLKYATV